MKDKKFPDIFSLNGKVAIITGGSGHLGKSLTRALSEAGAQTIIASRNFQNSDRFAQKINSTRCKPIAIQVDVTEKQSVWNLVDKVKEEYGKLDILVNCAANSRIENIEKMSVEDWDFTINNSLNSVFLTTQAVIEPMKKEGGSIINISSMYGLVSPYPTIYGDTGYNNPASYGAAKAGILQFTRYCACHLAKYSIRVNAISPGAFPSQDVQKRSPDFIKSLSERIPLNRIGDPWELKGAVVFLSSEASSYITGQNIIVDGGWTVW